MSPVISRPWLLFFVLLLGLMLAVEIGSRMRPAALDQRHQSLVQSARDGLTVLLSFLLGFALPMTLPYYEMRRDLMIEEANAIATVDQRAQLVPDPYRGHIRELLPQYADAQLDFAREGDDAAVRASMARAARLQAAMWREAVALVREHPDSGTSPIIAQATAALGNLADLNAKRLAAYERRIPETIWFVLTLLAVLTCFVVGYSMEERLLLTMLVLPLTVATVLSLVSELEFPRTGFIRIGQESMQRERLELRAELGH